MTGDLTQVYCNEPRYSLRSHTAALALLQRSQQRRPQRRRHPRLTALWHSAHLRTYVGQGPAYGQYTTATVQVSVRVVALESTTDATIVRAHELPQRTVCSWHRARDWRRGGLSRLALAGSLLLAGHLRSLLVVCGVCVLHCLLPDGVTELLATTAAAAAAARRARLAHM